MLGLVVSTLSGGFYYGKTPQYAAVHNNRVHNKRSLLYHQSQSKPDRRVTSGLVENVAKVAGERWPSGDVEERRPKIVM